MVTVVDPPGASPTEGDTLRTLVDDYIAAQRRLQTPIVRFSDLHDRQTPAAAPALTPLYRDLIPLSAPATGEQYAFEVDLDACSGCKACVAGCHSLNGLDENETWRDVGLIRGGSIQHPFQQTVTSACHHCVEPACLQGCPVLAYEKDPATGIVRHLDDQCIGCSYCVLKCPYDVPKYNARLGIVRKCDLCHGRLAVGEAPACAQACPTQAIRVIIVPTHAPSADATVQEGGAFLPGAPDPAYTQPATRYLSTRALPTNLRAADADTPRVQPAHLPLAVLLLCTQLAVGLQLAALMGTGDEIRGCLTAAWGLAVVGVAASVLHLGQPLRAWRIFLGLRQSWLSREAVFFGAWLGTLSLQVAQVWALLPAAARPTPAQETVLCVAALLFGAAGIACSAMIYIDTRRRAWRPGWTAGKFAGTVALAAAACAPPLTVAGLAAAKLVFEAVSVGLGPPASRRLLAGPLQALAWGRVLLGSAAIGLFVLIDASLSHLSPWAWALLLAGEAAERQLYFTAVDPSKMPGVSSS